MFQNLALNLNQVTLCHEYDKKEEEENENSKDLDHKPSV